MPLQLKAITAAAFLSIVPGLLAAQGIQHTGPGNIHVLPIDTQIPITNFGPGVGGAPGLGQPAQIQDCGAGYAQALVGQNVHTIPLPGHVRVIGPDTIVTFDYQTDRMNVAHDAGGTITRVYCG